MTVVPFKPKTDEADYIFVCQCRCASFTLRGDGTAACRACGSTADDGGWRHKAPDDVAFTGAISYSDGGNDGDFAERKTKRDVAGADWIIFGTEDGLVRAWCRHFIDSEEKATWIRDGVAAGMAAILEDKPL